jgi:hypothetical protein
MEMHTKSCNLFFGHVLCAKNVVTRWRFILYQVFIKMKCWQNTSIMNMIAIWPIELKVFATLDNYGH